ncbi:MFS transporter [Natronorubrum daqingense]|uniref:MFS transporter n=1 Tax=Natronorubrum daqingense TaxID=588898 RepID=A0A1N7F3J1_9EURY|nr:MFS transporter [Natronorubrum daqingense]APX97509.1 MFS transporter [Natronorubrum daqingense]SIR94859.1 Predicted arabinose efflux permease, MFS family [Natronorubrum daqingense]
MTTAIQSAHGRSWQANTLLILLWQVSASICFYAVYAVTPFVRDEFGLSATLIGVMVTAMMLGYTLFLVPAGAIIDTYGEGRTLVVGLLGLAGGAVGITAAPTYATVLGTVFVIGGFYATAIPGTNKAVFNVIPDDRLNTSMGIKQVGVTAGSGISSIVIPWFGATRFGWEVGFLLTGILAVVVTGVFRLMYGAGGAGSDASALDIRGHFAKPEYALLTAAGFFLGAGLFTTTGYTILFVEEAIGASVVFAGITLAVAQGSGSVGRIAFGWLADKLAAPLAVSTLRILLFQAAGASVLFFLATQVQTNLTSLVYFVFLGFFVLGFTGIYYSCIGSMVDPDEIGSATAGGQLALNGGALLAPPVFGFLVDTSGYDTAWAMLGVSTTVALALLVLARRKL